MKTFVANDVFFSAGGHRVVALNLAATVCSFILEGGRNIGNTNQMAFVRGLF
jgi:hypothetical protein